MATTTVFNVYCYCCCPDNGVLCDGTCGQLYHLNCLDKDRKENLFQKPRNGTAVIELRARFVVQSMICSFDFFKHIHTLYSL